MAFRQIDIPAFGRRLSNIMAHPSSADPDTHAHALDQYLQLGGNCIHLHGEGGEIHSRRATGEWLRRNGVRAGFFLCSQICHDGWDDTADCTIDRFTPQAVSDDIDTDLELLGTEYIDLVYLDDRPQTPAEPVIEAIRREIRRGRVRAFGVRNWTVERIHEALPAIGAIITTELALAAATAPLWPEYVPFNRGLRQLAGAFQLPVFAHATDINLGQCLYEDAGITTHMRRHWVERWDHPANPGLVQRVRRFAAERGLTPRVVNIAWLLNQHFPVVAVASLPSLTAYCSEYERASQLVLEEADFDLLEPRPHAQSL